MVSDGFDVILERVHVHGGVGHGAAAGGKTNVCLSHGERGGW
jgi:hypothetical protein